MQIDDPILEMLCKARVDLINTYIHNQDIHAKSCVLLDVRVQLANEHHAILQRLNDVIDERSGLPQKDRDRYCFFRFED